MEKYELYYSGYLIGKIEINNAEYTYQTIDNELDVFTFLKENSRGLLIDFPFIENRINNMKKFKLNKLQYQNSNYELIKVE